MDDHIRVAIEYHTSAAGRFRVDVLLAGNDGANAELCVITHSGQYLQAYT